MDKKKYGKVFRETCIIRLYKFIEQKFFIILFSGLYRNLLIKYAKTTKVRQNRKPIVSPPTLFQCDQSFQM